MNKFDAIVIGSGYGGSVSAFRLAEAGLNVAVLETGYEHKAPNIPRGKASEWNPDQGRFGPHNVQHLNNSVTAWRGTAVGGGSIINAAVMIRKTDFDNWPGGITRSALDPFYDTAERMLGATVYPSQASEIPTHPDYRTTVKTRVMLATAATMGVPSVTPPVAITYRAPGEAIGTTRLNQYGATQQGCRQCGECSLPGCNYQAKNSLDLTYLHGARELHGATIIAGMRVQVIYPKPEGGYSVTGTDESTGKSRTYEAKVVVVAAGSIGSSELLLRNKLVYRGLNFLSDKLGQQYTTNGTFIGFAVRSNKDLDPSGGPEITAGLDFQGTDGKGQGTLMFDGSFRGFSYDTFYITGLLARLPQWGIRAASLAFKLAEMIRLVQPRKTLPLLVIGRDKAVGQFKLNERGEMYTDLNPRDNTSFYKNANKLMREFCRTIGARFLPFPMWSLRKKIDVPHNLGGVPMGDSWREGVVDSYGRVYGYDNLLVEDGSIIPVTMGANPALTITALTERAMATVIPQLKLEGRIRANQAEPTLEESRQTTATGPVDITKAFEEAHLAVRFDRINPMSEPVYRSPCYQQKTVIWTQGILARHMHDHSVCAIDRLVKLGYEVTKSRIDTDVATLENIEVVKASVRQIPQGTGILIGHSRGGNINLDAYRELSSEDKKRIIKIILIQAPVNGSPVADFAIATNGRRRLIAFVSRLIFGNSVEETLVELSTRGRAAAQLGLAPLTAEDKAKIITVRSVIARKESSSFELPRRINWAAGQASDGMTPHAMSAIPGVRDVTLSGYDHEMLVIQNPSLLKRLTGYKPSKRYEAGDVIETLLGL